MKQFFTIILLIVFANIFAQSSPGKYWIQLSDKNNNGYTVNQPEDFLSQRAIDRRERYSIPVTYEDMPVTQIYIDSLEALGCEVILKSKWFNAVTIACTDTLLLDTIENISFIQHIDRFTSGKSINTQVNSNSGVQKIDDYFEYGQAHDQIHIHNGEILHNNGYRGNGMIIAVLDAGFTSVDEIAGFSHLFSDNRIIATRDFVDRDNDVYGHHSHGTMVLSTIAAYLPNEMIGTAPEASFVLIRTENGASEYKIEEDNWVSGVEFADSIGADVINSSLGYTTYDDSRQSYTYADMDGVTARISLAATMAASKGIAVVNSAGNSGAQSWAYIGAPADADSILSIAAVNTSGDAASFSSRGPASDGRLKPNVAAVGSGSTVFNTSGEITTAGGTSFSSPITAGLVACLWQAKPELTNMELFKLIQENSSQYSNPDTILGYGIPDYGQALLSIKELNGFSNDDEFALTSSNPVINEVSFNLYSARNQDINVGLYNILGKIIFTNTYRVYKYSEANFILNNLANEQNGLFILRVVTANKTYEVKLIKE